MLNAIFRPVEDWPGKPKAYYSRVKSKFKAPYAGRLDLLERELTHLHASDIVIQTYHRREDIRNDGWPRSNARVPDSPGVIVTFYNRKKETYSYPGDTYTRWEDNLYAIALSLEALRSVDRYGVTQSGEQYQGFKRLESPAVVDPRAAAMAFIQLHTGLSGESVRNDIQGAYQLAARKLHPDAGGSHEAFVKLQEHYRNLRVQ